MVQIRVIPVRLPLRRVELERAGEHPVQEVLGGLPEAFGHVVRDDCAVLEPREDGLVDGELLFLAHRRILHPLLVSENGASTSPRRGDWPGYDGGRRRRIRHGGEAGAAGEEDGFDEAPDRWLRVNEELLVPKRSSRTSLTFAGVTYLKSH